MANRLADMNAALSVAIDSSTICFLSRFAQKNATVFANSSVSAVNFFTLRDKGYDKGPSPWDLRHQFKFNGIWELPFGPGKRWNTSHGWFNRIIEGWETSATNRWQDRAVLCA